MEREGRPPASTSTTNIPTRRDTASSSTRSSRRCSRRSIKASRTRRNPSLRLSRAFQAKGAADVHAAGYDACVRLRDHGARAGRRHRRCDRRPCAERGDRNQAARTGCWAVGRIRVDEPVGRQTVHGYRRDPARRLGHVQSSGRQPHRLFCERRRTLAPAGREPLYGARRDVVFRGRQACRQNGRTPRAQPVRDRRGWRRRGRAIIKASRLQRSAVVPGRG